MNRASQFFLLLLKYTINNAFSDSTILFPFLEGFFVMAVHGKCKLLLLYCVRYNCVKEDSCHVGRKREIIRED